MNPHQQNKVDISSMSADEQRLFRMYGKLPNKKDLLQNKLKERKYFDSGDYALSKAGKASDTGISQIGREHPVPENIPHSSTPTGENAAGGINSRHGSVSGGLSGGVFSPPLGAVAGSSPVKESSFLNRETSAEDLEAEEADKTS